MSLITKRTEFEEGQATYLDCEDERALGIDDCGCGLPRRREIKPWRVGTVEGLQVTFWHIGVRCVVAVRHDTKTDEWIPVTWEEYHGLTREMVEDGNDQSV